MERICKGFVHIALGKRASLKCSCLVKCWVLGLYCQHGAKFWRAIWTWLRILSIGDGKNDYSKALLSIKWKCD